MRPVRRTSGPCLSRWAAANRRPAFGTTDGTALYNQIVNMVNGQKTAAGALPANFFTIPLGQNFYGRDPNSFDITTLEGYKLYKLRTVYNPAFGTLNNNNTPRAIQFALKLYF